MVSQVQAVTPSAATLVVPPAGDQGDLSPWFRRFDRCVDRHGDRQAIVHDETVWSYRAFGEAADRIATSLVATGVQRGDCVGICASRGPGAIAAMLGIHRAGAAFVPLDPDYPADRLAFMAEDAAVGVILTEPLGVDVREFPDRETATRQFQSLVRRGVRLHFIYTGGVAGYYNCARQLWDMLARRRLERTSDDDVL